MAQPYRVLLEPEPDGGFHAFVPCLPGVHTHGATEEEALRHVREAIEIYLEDLHAQGEEPVDFREAEVVVGK